MQFEARILSADNVMSQIVIDAQSEEDARRQIAAQGAFAAAIQPLSAGLSGTVRLGRPGGQRLSLVLFSQELLALLNAGLSIVEALEALLEKEAGEAMRTVLDRLLTGLREGKRFSAVLADQPDLFPPLYVGIVKAAEGTSDLPRALSRFIDYQQRIDAVRSKIVSAAIYPAILMLVGGGVSIFLMTFVVPRFAEVYAGAGRSLPWLSQLLLDWGRYSSAHTSSVLLAGAIIAVALVVSVGRLLRGGGVGQLLGRVPALGERLRIHELARLYLTLGMLTEGGIPVVSAMTMVEGMVSTAIRDGLKGSRSLIEAGTPLSTAFDSQGLTTPISLRLLRVGERTGEMSAMLSQSAAFYDGEITRWIDRFTRSFEPLLMAAIGVVVGVIVVSLYMPIFDLAGSLS